MAPPSPPLTVGLVQINNTIFGQRYLPYSVGLLEAYVHHNAPQPERYRFLPLLFRREAVATMAAHLAQADVVGLSTYMWSFELSLAVAKAVKAHRPEVIVILGGPHVPPDSEPFLRAHRYVDVLCHGEGERAFLAFLEGCPGRQWEGIPGLSFLAGASHHHTPRGPRIKNLAEIPSPYLSGAFAPLIEAHPDQKWLACWETNRGCPFSCTFCDWGSAVASKVTRFDMERVGAEIAWFAAHQVDFVFCCDANFGILPRDLDIAQELARVRRVTGYPKEVSVQNTKNATERAYAVQRLLSEAGLNKEIALSLQSVDDVTLKAIRRSNIALGHFEELQRRFVEDGSNTYTDVVLGLPGETYASFTRGVGSIIDRGQTQRIKFYNLGLLPGAEMATPAQREAHGLITSLCRLINIHGPLDEQTEVPEFQEVVIGTATMPPEDWARARAFAWMCELCFFDRLLQMPMSVARRRLNLPYERQVEALCETKEDTAPTVARIQRFFIDKAQDIQRGGSEHCESERWRGSFWPANNYAMIQLQSAGRLDAFYDEALAILAALAKSSGGEGDGGDQAPRRGSVILAAGALNRSLLPALRALG